MVADWLKASLRCFKNTAPAAVAPSSCLAGSSRGALRQMVSLFAPNGVSICARRCLYLRQMVSLFPPAHQPALRGFLLGLGALRLRCSPRCMHHSLFMGAESAASSPPSARIAPVSTERRSDCANPLVSFPTRPCQSWPGAESRGDREAQEPRRKRGNDMARNHTGCSDDWQMGGRGDRQFQEGR